MAPMRKLVRPVQMLAAVVLVMPPLKVPSNRVARRPVPIPLALRPLVPRPLVPRLPGLRHPILLPLARNRRAKIHLAPTRDRKARQARRIRALRKRQPRVPRQVWTRAGKPVATRQIRRPVLKPLPRAAT
jgi:hypothetical protein